MSYEESRQALRLYLTLTLPRHQMEPLVNTLLTAYHKGGIETADMWDVWRAIRSQIGDRLPATYDAD